MSKVIIGCDPDSSKHGIAMYINGKLELLECMTTINVYRLLLKYKGCDIELHIENVCGVSNSGFHYGRKDSQAVRAKKSENVGMCKQAQREVEAIANDLGIKVVHHKISKQWKHEPSKAAFKRITGWTGRSNEDSRSAAYMGFQGLR